MTKIKICGITNQKDAFYSATLGANYLGFNFYKNSPRRISVKMASSIVSKLPSCTEPVGIFVDEQIEKIKMIIEKTKIKIIQLHGKEDVEFCQKLKNELENIKLIKTIKIKDENSVSDMEKYIGIVDFFLFDTYNQNLEGGTSTAFNWDIALNAKKYNVPLFLAGGLTPENVTEAIKKLQPYAVDVASGVERLPRRKDYDKLKQFILNVQKMQ